METEKRKRDGKVKRIDTGKISLRYNLPNRKQKEKTLPKIIVRERMLHIQNFPFKSNPTKINK